MTREPSDSHRPWTKEDAWHRFYNSNLFGVFIFNLTGEILSANERFLELVDRSPADLKAGKISWLKLTTPSLIKKVYDAKTILLESGRVGPWETEFTTRQGQRRMVAFTATLLSNRETGLAVLADMTERQKAEETRRSFILGVSHELRSPMTNVLCFLQLLEKSQALLPQDRDFLEVAKRNARRLSVLINSMMEMGKIEMAPPSPQGQVVDLRVVLRRVIIALLPQAQAKRLTLSDESSAAEECTLVGDEERLEQLVSNLLVNAIKYTDQGEVRASVCLDEAHDMVELRVQDTGVGIPEEEQNKIYEPFYRVAGDHTQQNEGVGLGLRTVKTVAEQHGGKVTLTSLPGQGSTFVVLLPRNREHQNPAF